MHALDIDGLTASEVTAWTVWEDDSLLGIGALKELDAGHGEVKSMRTTAAARGRGVASRLLVHLLNEAGRRGYSRVSLETGTEVYFAAARRLYERNGFIECKPFADYEVDPVSIYCSRRLSESS